ncbi:alpha/beta hydrolase [Microbacterium aurantiacum]|uniref:alpha/beta hydrolase n=1 Tax=Microbacterium aurantiacum TaxID=162393 RepID=UPI001FEB5A8F|nr:alpha/beta hydrolase fold domain-containing protein [Microbacterium aurantiacum]
MAIDPFFARRLAPLRESTWSDIRDDPTHRADFLEPLKGWRIPEDVEITEGRAAQPDGVGVRIYRGPRQGGARPGLVWMHGGGFSSGSVDMCEAHVVAAELASRAGAVVVSVDYRLATGGVHYPVPLDDVTTAWRWLVAERASLGIDGALFIGGASAGANLAAGAALRERDMGRVLPDAMLLAYGVFHLPGPGGGHPAADSGELPPFLRGTAEAGMEIIRGYLGTLNAIPAYASPGSTDLRGMPRAAIVAAEYDELYASSAFFAAQLGDAGVGATTYLAKGMIHGHLNWGIGPELPEAEQTIQFFADQISGAVSASRRPAGGTVQRARAQA